MIRFVHTADWQIGKAFGGFPAEMQGVLRDARLSAVDRIADIARGHGATHVLVAGDVYDCGTLPARDVSRLIERLKAHAPLVWQLLPGNHDPDRHGGLYERLIRGGLPENVRLCRDAQPMPLAPGVVLLPAPLKSRAETRDPTAWMDRAETTAGSLRIGLAHGSVQGFGSSSEAAARIDPGRRRAAGLAYLALGDWHGTKEVAEGVWYAGTPEPERYLDNEPGQVLAVTIGAGASCLEVKAHPTGLYRWQATRLSPRAAADVDAFEQHIAAGGGAVDRLLLRLEVRGGAGLAAHGEIAARLALLGERLFHLDLDLDGFAVLPEADDLARLGAGSGLERVARQLMALKEHAETAPEAGRALEILHRLAAGQRS
jgi:DNA repair exonuclease SbcCD nuclease subunit